MGDIIVYQPPDVGGARIIHRIVGGDAVDGWVMRGDNNNFLDPWKPKGSEVLGVARLRIAGAGKLALIVLSPVFWGSMILLAGALLAWPRSQAEPDDAAPDDAAPGDGTSGDGDASDDRDTPDDGDEPDPGSAR